VSSAKCMLWECFVFVCGLLNDVECSSAVQRRATRTLKMNSE
jgi:hypothetical protein